MDTILLFARSGKTTALIHMAAARPGTYIVSLDKQRAASVMRTARTLGLAIPHPLTLDELRRPLGPRVKALVFDDADDMLRALARGLPVLAFTATAPDTTAGNLEHLDGLMKAAELEAP